MLGVRLRRETLLKITLHDIACQDRPDFVCMTRDAYLAPLVSSAGEACTKERKLLVLTSLVKDDIARKSSNTPAGGFGAS